MNNIRPGAPRRHGWTAIGVVAVGVVLAAILVMWPFESSAPTAWSPIAPTPDVVPAPEAANASSLVSSEMAVSKTDAMGADFWRNMLESAECDLVTGYGSASNIAVVLGPTGTGPAKAGPAGGGVAFRVIDDTGTLFEDELPFDPAGVRLRKHADGRVLTGFSNIRLGEAEIFDPSSSQPVVVYQDGEKIYEAYKVWVFDVAPDGSAFYTIEPEPDESSSLTIRDLDGAVVRSHDLEYLFTPAFNHWPYSAWFAYDDDEIVLMPGSLHQDNIFYPVDGGEPRTIRYEGEKALLGGVLASSQVGFHVYHQSPDEPLLVVRKEFNWDLPTMRESDIWSTEIDLLHFYDTAYLSDDQRYLLLQAWNTHLLDAQTGRILFAHPAAENFERTLGDAPSVGKVSAVGAAYRKADRERLASIVEPGEGQDDGPPSAYGFQNGDLYAYRRIGLKGMRQCSIDHSDDRDAERACEERLRESGEYSEVQDLFDLESIQIDSQPYRRIAYERGGGGSEYECRPGRESGLAFEDGILRYVGQEY